MDLLNRISIELPEPPLSVDEQGLRTYKIAEQQRSFVRGVINNVDNALKSLTGYSRENLPEDFVKHPFEFGDISGSVNVKPTSSTSYRPIHDALVNYIDNKLEQGTKSVSVQDLVDSYNSWKESFTNCTLEQKIEFVLPEVVDVPDTPKKAIFFADVSEYANLNRQAIVDRFTAAIFDDYLKKQIITPFDKMVKNKALEELGLDEDNLEETAKTMIREGDRAFKVQVIPRPSTSWGKIMSALFYVPASGNVLKMGDIAGLSFMCEEDNLDDVVQRYNATKRPKGLYIYLENLKERLGELTEEHTKISKRLEWEYDPILEIATAISG